MEEDSSDLAVALKQFDLEGGNWKPLVSFEENFELNQSRWTSSNDRNTHGWRRQRGAEMRDRSQLPSCTSSIHFARKVRKRGLAFLYSVPRLVQLPHLIMGRAKSPMLGVPASWPTRMGCTNVVFWGARLGSFRAVSWLGFFRNLASQDQGPNAARGCASAAKMRAAPGMADTSNGSPRGRIAVAIVFLSSLILNPRSKVDHHWEEDREPAMQRKTGTWSSGHGGLQEVIDPGYCTLILPSQTICRLQSTEA